MNTINKITRAEYPDVFDVIGEEGLFDDYVTESHNEHRRQSNFFTRRIILINDEYFPTQPELHGYWETNTFVDDHEYGCDYGDVKTLTRVELKTKIVEVSEWVPVN